MVKDAFHHVDAWVFDLDNTLYPPHARLFDQIEVRMTAWVQRVTGADRACMDEAQLTCTLGTQGVEHRHHPHARTHL